MTTTAQKIYEHLKIAPQYTYSQDIAIRQKEVEAVDELIQLGLIRVKARAIGFIIADAF